MTIKIKLYMIISIAVTGLLIAVGISFFGFSKTKAGIRQLTSQTAPLQIKVMELQQESEKLSSAFIRLGLLSANDSDIHKISSQISNILSDIKKIVTEIRTLDSDSASIDMSMFDNLQESVVATVSQRLKSMEAMRSSSAAVTAQLKAVEDIGTKIAGDVKKASVNAVSTSDNAQRSNSSINESINKMKTAQMRMKDIETILVEMETIKSRFKLTPLKERIKSAGDGIQSIVYDKGDPVVIKEAKFIAASAVDQILKEGTGLFALRSEILSNKDAEEAYQKSKREIRKMLEDIQMKLAEQADTSALQASQSMNDLKRSSEYRTYASRTIEATSDIQVNIKRLLGTVQLVMLSSGENEISAASNEISTARRQLSAGMDVLKRSITLSDMNYMLKHITGIHDALKKADAAIVAVTVAKRSVVASELAMQSTIENIKKITEEQSREGDAKVKIISAKFADVVSSLNNTVTSATTVMAIVSGVVIISILIFAVGTAFSITRPLKRITDAIVNIAEGNGDLTARLPAAGKDELGKLSTGFNKLISKLQRNISTVSEKVNTIASAASELSATSDQLTIGARSQANQTASLSNTAEQMSGASLSMANEAKFASDFAEATKIVALTGNIVVGEAVEGIKSVATSIAEITGSISGLSEHSMKIGEISSVIKGIADQTNLLALNAAIEAARAGDQGLGFAVVADSVRQLSERTAIATVQIEGMVRAIQQCTDGVSQSMSNGLQNVNAVVERANKAGETLKDIVCRVEKKAELIQKMSVSAQEQSAAVDSMREGLETVVNVSNNFAAGSVQIAQTSGELNRAAIDLQDVVLQFRI